MVTDSFLKADVAATLRYRPDRGSMPPGQFKDTGTLQLRAPLSPSGLGPIKSMRREFLAYDARSLQAVGGGQGDATIKGRGRQNGDLSPRVRHKLMQLLLKKGSIGR